MEIDKGWLVFVMCVCWLSENRKWNDYIASFCRVMYKDVIKRWVCVCFLSLFGGDSCVSWGSFTFLFGYLVIHFRNSFSFLVYFNFYLLLFIRARVRVCGGGCACARVCMYACGSYWQLYECSAMLRYVRGKKNTVIFRKQLRLNKTSLPSSLLS